MRYVLATTGDKVQWYKFKPSTELHKGEYVLLDELDLKQVPSFGDKDTAKHAALALGLKTWRYFKY